MPNVTYRMNYGKILGTIILTVTAVVGVFPEVIYLLGVSPRSIPFIWQTAILFYAVTLISLFLLSKLWPDYFRSWEKAVWVSLAISAVAIITTPASTSGGWLFSPPDKEEVTWYLNLVFGLMSVCLILWQFISRRLPKIFPSEARIGRKTFLKKIVATVVSFFLVYFIASQIPFFEGVFDFDEDLLSILFSTFLVGGILILHIIYFIHLCSMRLRDANRSKKWTFLLIAPLFLLAIPFGILLFILVSPIYLIAVIVLSILPSASIPGKIAETTE